MNNRRRVLQFLGLGSLFATTGGLVTANQARAARGMEPLTIDPRHAEEIMRTKWEHRIIRLESPIREGIAATINSQIDDGESEFVSLSEVYGGVLLVFRKRVLWSDATPSSGAAV